MSETMGLLERLRAENAEWKVGPVVLEAADAIEALHKALAAITDHYVSLAKSGDAGFWDPEKEEQVIAARHALALSKGSDV